MANEPDNNNQGHNPNDPGYYAPPEDKYEDMHPQQDTPAVSAPAAKNFIFIGVFGIIVVIIIYAFFSGSTPHTTHEVSNHFVPPKSNQAQPIVIPPPPTIPTPVAPPPPTTETVQPPKPRVFEEDTQRTKRFRSDMLITKGGILGGTEFGSSKAQVSENDPNVGFADNFYNQKDAPFAQARKLGDTSRLITQGKIIESILETPINTDLPGMIRAIVSHDIYAESGRVILIPKGSRLVGTYNNSIIRGAKRVSIIWSRVIRPDGIDVMIRSEGADQLGRAGVEGDVDNKYEEIFASAVLVSAINIAAAAGVDALEGNNNNSTTQNTDGSTTQNITAKDQAAIQAIDMFGNTGENLINGFLNQRPTITIDQGTRVNVFVNRDLIFPRSVAGQVKIIQ